MKRIAIISDIHANALALKVALKSIELNNVDLTIFLGDLLTYGVAVEETVKLMKQFSSENEVVFISGNHEQIYFDAQKGKDFEYKPFPAFILDSVKYTVSELERIGVELKSEFNWVDEYVFDDFYFSHANPFGKMNWAYINSDEDLYRASIELERREFSFGFFGHTHRSVCARVGRSKAISYLDDTAVCSSSSSESIVVVNPGSLGQPRGELPSWALVNIYNSEVTIERKSMNYDIKAHMSSIRSVDFSNDTKTKLLGFFDR